MTKLDAKDQIALAEMAKDIGYIKDEIKEIKENLDNKYVQRSEFTPIRSIVIGMVAIVLTSFLGGVISLVF